MTWYILHTVHTYVEYKLPSRGVLCVRAFQIGIPFVTYLICQVSYCASTTHHNLFRKKELSSYLRTDTQVVWTTLSPSPYVEDRQYDTFFCRYAAPTSTYHLPVASSSLSSSENPPSPSLLLFHHSPSSNTEDSPLI